MRIVVDTNVIVSGVAYPNSIPGCILQELRQLRWDLVLSGYIVNEIMRVLPRVLRPRMADNAIQTLVENNVENLLFLAEMVALPERIDIVEPRLRDRNDQPVLQTLLLGNADCLVTGDKDLLVLSAHYPILPPAEFWRRYGNKLH